DPSRTLIGLGDDADTNTTGFQLRTFGTANGELTMELALMGGAMPQTTGPQTPTNDSLLHDFTIPATGTTTYTVVLTAKDGAGNSCIAMRPVDSDFVGPVATITSPTDAGSPYSSFSIPVSVSVTDQGNHAEMQDVTCTSTLGNIGGPFKVMN